MSYVLKESPSIDPTAQVLDTELGRWTEILARSQLVECAIGDYSYVMNDCDLMYTRVGKFCSIASHVRLNPSNHPMWRPTLHHFTYRSTKYGFGGEDDDELFAWRKEHVVTLGHDVWIGHGAIILPGVRIGTGAVVGAGAVVTKDVPQYAIAVGMPAKPVKERFPPQVQEALLRIAWWDWPHEKFEQTLEDFRTRDVREFIAKHDISGT